jgi:hypothetical protein
MFQVIWLQSIFLPFMFCHGKFTVLQSVDIKSGIKTYKRIAYSITSNAGVIRDTRMEESCKKSLVAYVPLPEDKPRRTE